MVNLAKKNLALDLKHEAGEVWLLGPGVRDLAKNEQIDTIHRLRFVEKWTVRKIARHLGIGRRTVTQYLSKPVQVPLHRTRTSKLDPFKPEIAEWLQKDPSVTAAVIFQWVRDRGFAGGYTIVKSVCADGAYGRRAL